MQASKKGHSISVQAHENVAIYQSTKVLTVAGEGFKPKGTKFRFANALEVGTNFTVQTEESSAVFELMNGSRWKQVRCKLGRVDVSMRARATGQSLQAPFSSADYDGKDLDVVVVLRVSTCWRWDGVGKG